MTISTGIARELPLVWTSRAHSDVLIADLRKRDPHATTAELHGVCQVGTDQIDLYPENKIDTAKLTMRLIRW